jgi:hypothetical protein
MLFQRGSLSFISSFDSFFRNYNMFSIQTFITKFVLKLEFKVNFLLHCEFIRLRNNADFIIFALKSFLIKWPYQVFNIVL